MLLLQSVLQVVTLLLHQHRSQEALSHFQQHLATYRKPPSQLDPVPSAAAASHWGWVARQNQAMGELMSSRVDPAHLPPQVSGYRTSDMLYSAACCCAILRSTVL